MPATSRPAFDEAFPEQALEARPRLEVIEGGGMDGPSDTEPGSGPDAETVDQAQEEEPANFGRAAAGAGTMIRNYVESPTKRPARERHSYVTETKNKSTRNRDNEFKGGDGGKWWRDKVREAKETHEDTCNCIFCVSPEI